MIGCREKPFATSDVETRVLDTATDKVNRRPAIGLHLAQLALSRERIPLRLDDPRYQGKKGQRDYGAYQ